MLMKVPVDGGAAITVSGAFNPTGVVVDQTSIYCTDQNLGAVFKLTPK